VFVQTFHPNIETLKQFKLASNSMTRLKIMERTHKYLCILGPHSENSLYITLTLPSSRCLELHQDVKLEGALLL